MRYLALWLAVLMLISMSSLYAEMLQPPPQYQDRYYALLKELRCLVCQNETLSDSHAGLAQDLRNQVTQMLEAGSSDAQIIDFMVERYGDFVLYKPRFKPSTYLLWVGPFVLFVLSLLVLFRVIRKRGQVDERPLSGDEQIRLNRLLNNDQDTLN